jgi:hypothetical protein
MKYIKTVVIVFLALLPSLMLLRYAKLHEPQVKKVVTKVEKPVYAEPSKLSPIEQEIKDVFGSYYPVAMELLTSDACHENKALNPNAVNDNTTWGGIGRDLGVFQINTTWQGVTNEAFLFDPHINIRIAYNIFVRSGYNFKMWTCGKKLGI